MKKTCPAIIMTIAMLLTCGCSAKSIEEKTIENAIGDGTQVDIKNDSYAITSTDGTTVEIGGTEWPDDAAANHLPRFTAGTVESMITSDGYFSISFQDVEQTDFEAYLNSIKSDGFTVDSIVSQSDGSYYYQAADGNQRYVALTYESEQKAMYIISTVEEKTAE